ncbi:MAG: hypothetical protein MJ097_06765 [Dorea sp.]|nr:hypothetical protein [Dorea sp.]
MNEKAFKTMTNAAAVNIAIGIVMTVVGITTGALAIFSGISLIKDKKGLIF